MKRTLQQALEDNEPFVKDEDNKCIKRCKLNPNKSPFTIDAKTLKILDKIIDFGRESHINFPYEGDNTLTPIILFNYNGFHTARAIKESTLCLSDHSIKITMQYLYPKEISIEYFMKLLCDDYNGGKKNITNYEYDTDEDSKIIKTYMDYRNREKVEQFLLNKQVMKYAKDTVKTIENKDDIYDLPETDQSEEEEEQYKPNFQFLEYMKENLMNVQTFVIPWADEDDDHDIYSKSAIEDIVYLVGIGEYGHIIGYYYHSKEYASRKVINWWSESDTE